MDGTLGRFGKLSEVVAGYGIEQSTSSTTALNLVGSKVVLAGGEAKNGQIYRWTIAGSKTGANAAFTMDLLFNGTSVATLTSDDATAVEWCAEITLYIAGGATQKIITKLFLDTADNDINYVAGTTDMRSGCEMKVKITSGHGSDTLTTGLVMVEKLGA